MPHQILKVPVLREKWEKCNKYGTGDYKISVVA
jgi:hypothetical protein